MSLTFMAVPSQLAALHQDTLRSAAPAIPGCQHLRPSKTALPSSAGRQDGCSIALGVTAGVAAVMSRSTRSAQRRAQAGDTTTVPKEEAAKPKADEPITEAESATAAAVEPEPAEPEPPKVITNRDVGVTEPLGFWDPLGLASPDDKIFKSQRAMELKHGRVAMMAAAGAVVQHSVSFPGFGDMEARGMGAISEYPGNIGFLLLLGLIAALELTFWKEREDVEPGNFGDPAGLLGTSFGSYELEMRNKELNNGRFAMFASIGIILAEDETGKDAIEQIFGI